jgi:hypothetical protein
MSSAFNIFSDFFLFVSRLLHNKAWIMSFIVEHRARKK